MGIALVSGPFNATVSGSTITLTVTGTNAGDALVIGIRFNSATITVNSVTVSGESNATLHTLYRHTGMAGTPSLQFASHPELTAGGTKTVTITFSSAPSAGSAGAFALCLSGQNKSSFFDAEAMNNVGGSSNTHVSLTTSANNAAIVAQCVSNSADGTQGAGFTLIPLANLNYYDSAEYQLDAGLAGARNVPFGAIYGGWIIHAAAFKASGAVTHTGSVAETLTIADKALPLQGLAPGSDVAPGGWTNPGGGGSLYVAVDETVRDDGDKIQSSSNPSNDTVELKFQTGTLPFDRSSHYVSYAIGVEGGAASAVVTLMCGALAVASWTHPSLGALQTFTRLLTEAEAGAIIDYADLRLRITAD